MDGRDPSLRSRPVLGGAKEDAMTRPTQAEDYEEENDVA